MESPVFTLISSLTEARELPIGSAMKRSVLTPATMDGGMVKVVLAFPRA
jgi:hypothetical protein